uniref:Uncharacterized protein n=1 Tax=Cacopsylla melanoneura TaxID=428564 RepID=A0A8D8UE85_9HEMI
MFNYLHRPLIPLLLKFSILNLYLIYCFFYLHKLYYFGPFVSYFIFCPIKMYRLQTCLPSCSCKILTFTDFCQKVNKIWLCVQSKYLKTSFWSRFRLLFCCG